MIAKKSIELQNEEKTLFFRSDLFLGRKRVLSSNQAISFIFIFKTLLYCVVPCGFLTSRFPASLNTLSEQIAENDYIQQHHLISGFFHRCALSVFNLPRLTYVPSKSDFFDYCTHFISIANFRRRWSLVAQVNQLFWSDIFWCCSNPGSLASSLGLAFGRRGRGFQISLRADSLQRKHKVSATELFR